jgi:hypothetical protein
MKKNPYVTPRSDERLLHLQYNALASGSTDSVHDNGLPSLEDDTSTLNWFDTLE